MSPIALGSAGFAIVLALIVLRMPVAVAMGITGVVGLWLIGNDTIFSYLMGTVPYESSVSYTLSVVPLFIAMGVFAGRAGLTKQLYDLAYAHLSTVRGGLAIATIGACAGFGAICGSAVATTATMARVAVPEMLRHGFDQRLATAVVSAGGTLGILIPPSIILIIYALLTEQSVGNLFVGAIVPGLVATLLYMGAVVVSVRFNPDWAPRSVKTATAQKVRTTFAALPVIGLFTIVIGGIYSGIFTANEAAAVGAVLALAFCFFNGTSRRVLLAGLPETAGTCASIFLILIAAGIFNAFLELTELPPMLVEWIMGYNPSTVTFLILLSIFYIVLGTVMDEMAMILLTLPIVYPLLGPMGIDPVWFGVYLVTIVEIGLITPPVGLNLFVTRGVTGVPVSKIAHGVIPFIFADLLRLSLIIAFPQLVTFLPMLMNA